MNLYYRRKFAGLCVRCGKVNNSDRVMCDKCNEEHKSRLAEKQNQRLANGKCITCDAPNNNGKKQCDACLEKMKTANQEVRNFRKSIGVCVRCGSSEVLAGKNLCYDCDEKAYNESLKYKYEYTPERAQKKIDRYNERKSEGLCIICGKPTCEKSTIHCYEHLISQRKSNKKHRRKNGAIPTEERRYMGICLWCNEPAVEGKAYCQKHYEKQRDLCIKIGNEYRQSEAYTKRKNER